jgi:hypothetical protein
MEGSFVGIVCRERQHESSSLALPQQFCGRQRY